uniref:Phosphotransferase n=1 Tax=Chromera velia CCMP2878 TaxID=1169474 RepID=A0A0G4HLB0_9ALVE|mmetsp:Transcript_16328/g.33172  ORF Transcript_16328/g.33172 Transcript_16328/m.33172 type:complete len:539 (-) Transcript_16328:404-2020(-)|eukprot:Cvel_28726.t1-p1 / transcript=Cvel_28726.t1 / gene=Cvel_28726 / organism=Chromera_velia_CCMP2878 / gene_product=Hexokinase, putative / transcript_product=Hexokinase, putative / location=Cvel_scaffold3813:9047-10660(+) / protein_length=538 / sequence_SO=supercontig / SO=protein_coding / is_pseudo=false
MWGRGFASRHWRAFRASAFGATTAAAAALALPASGIVLCETKPAPSREARFGLEGLKEVGKRSPMEAPSLPSGDIKERWSLVQKDWSLTKPQLDKMVSSFLDELQKGLESRGTAGCFKMLDSCVTKIPTGNETGVYYSIDFGGTNLRVARFELKGDGKIKGDALKANLMTAGPPTAQKGLMDKTVSAREMFDHMADQVKQKIEIHGDAAEGPISVGFTFSFPSHQVRLDHSALAVWTKDFETGRGTDDPVEGQDVGALLKRSFKEKKIPADLKAIMNDTVGTLLSCAYANGGQRDFPPVYMGLILGTGSNGCYLEPQSASYGYTGNIINIEYGNFNRDLPTTPQDRDVDFNCDDPADRGKQLYEKMVAGKYMGELARRLTCFVLQESAPTLAWAKNSFPSEAASIVLKDNTADLSETAAVIQKYWGEPLPFESRVFLKGICTLVMDRSAALAAMGIAAVSIKTGRLERGRSSRDRGVLGMTVAVDGSLYTQNRWYADRLHHYLELILGRDRARLINVCTSNDGSGMGAAILVAAEEQN